MAPDSWRVALFNTLVIPNPLAGGAPDNKTIMFSPCHGVVT